MLLIRDATTDILIAFLPCKPMEATKEIQPQTINCEEYLFYWTKMREDEKTQHVSTFVLRQATDSLTVQCHNSENC